MNVTWEEWLSDLREDGAALLATELRSFLRSSLVDNDVFVREQARRVEHSMKRLAGGELTKRQFESNIADVADLAEMQVLRESVRSRASVQRFADGVYELVLNRLVATLP